MNALINNEVCTLADVRYDVTLYASTDINEKGEPDEEELICRIMDVAKEWQPSDEPYWCAQCDQYFKDWASAKTHLGMSKEVV